MRDYALVYLDKKFPNKIEVFSKTPNDFPGLIMQWYTSGEKDLFVKLLGGTEFAYHYFEAKPQDLQVWFGFTYNEAEKKLLDWVNERLKKEETTGIYGV